MVRTLVAFVSGAVLALGAVLVSLPHCPTEDSCSPDYQSHWFGDFWTGKEQVP